MPAPIFALHAQAATALALVGRAVILSVTASGTTPFSTCWYTNGAAITGATGSSDQISSVVTGDAGTYTAVVANGAGKTTSDCAVLTVHAAPSFTIQPVSLAKMMPLADLPIEPSSGR